MGAGRVSAPMVADTSPALALALAAAALVAAPARPVQARPPEPGWFVLNTWYQRHGLPENTIRALVHTRDGYLWIATHAGVARFDGVRFTVFDERQRGQLPEMEVQSLIEGADGSVWMGTFGGGLVQYKDGRFRRYTVADGLANDFVLILSRDQEGAIWAGTENGLSRYHQGRFRTFTTADGLLKNEVFVITLDRDGSLWLGTRNGGLSRYANGRFETQSIPGIKPTDIVRAVVRGRDGTLWIGGYFGVVARKGGETRHYTTADGLASDRVYSLHEDFEGNLWIGSDRGLNYVQGGEIHGIPTLAGRAFTALGSHREGCVWAGSGWLACLLKSQFTNHSADDGLPHHYATTFFEDQQGSVWIATITGLGRVRDGAVAAVPADRGLPAAAFTAAVVQDRAGLLWVGTDVGLYRSLTPLRAGDPTGIPRFERVEDQPQPTVQARGMHVDRAGTVWIATVKEGLVAYQDGRFAVYSTRDGLLDNSIRGLREDRAGNLWMGTRQGLHRFRDGKFEVFRNRPGLPDGAVDAVHFDANGALWIATRQGVVRHDQGRFTTYTVHDGLPSGYVNSFVNDDQGNLWMTSIRGLFRVRLQELDEFAAGKRRSLTPALYGTEHGLLSTRATASIDGSAYKTRDGRVWFATVRGASVIDPRRLPRLADPPPVHIEGVSVDGLALGAGARLVAPPGRGDIAIQYTGIGFVAPEKLRFKYRLAGYDPDWVTAGNRRAAFYSNIPPGHYAFQVIAANHDGVWNQVGATMALHLRPHWYQTWLFQATAALGLVLAGVAAYRRRVQRLHRRQHELEQRVAERTAALAVANRELESFGYSVSHDLRQPLRALDGFSRALLERQQGRLDDESQDLLRRMVSASARMERLIEDMFMLSRVNRIEIQRATVDLSALVREIYDELALAHPQRAVTLQIAPDLEVQADPSLMRIVIQNLLGNAWKFTSRVAAPHIEVGSRARPGKTPVFFVRDNGAGFESAFAGKLFVAFKRLHAQSEFEGSGIGLATVARVIQRHGGEVWAEGAVGQGATFYFVLD